MAKKILKGAFGVAGALLGIGGKKKKKPEPGPVVMPLADDEEVRRAKRRSIATQMQRGGRSSTILTDGRETLGGY